ncbi:MAG: hypothetical protein HN341_18130 [Verrucomicrobia bacterium]|jgi:hypothetical protein|nr:hypothetical protein [Verrucomicrobiota bacterium]
MKGRNDISWVQDFLSERVPKGNPLSLRTPLQGDEAHWFRSAAESGLFKFHECTAGCGRLRRWGRGGRDEFLTPKGQQRHLFSFAKERPCRLNAEYLPHIGAVARLILEFGYDQSRFSFSLYRTFSRDLIHKKAGQWYETDSEFYDSDSSIWLQVEAKRTRQQAEALAAAIEQHGFSSERVAKELEYVLDLSPRYLWIVGAGCIGTDALVYEVKEVDGVMAKFDRLAAVPGPPDKRI